MRKIFISLFIGLLLGMVLGVMAHRQWLEWFPSGSPFAKAAPPATQPPPPTTQPAAPAPAPPASTPAPPSTPPASTPPPPTQTAPPAPAPTPASPTGDQFADVPTWIPVYPGSKLTGRRYSNGLVVYNFSTEVKATEVVSFYEGQLRNAGWTPEATQPGLPTQWEKGEQTISLSISESMTAKSGQGRKTTIQVISAGEGGK